MFQNDLNFLYIHVVKRLKQLSWNSPLSPATHLRDAELQDSPCTDQRPLGGTEGAVLAECCTEKARSHLAAAYSYLRSSYKDRGKFFFVVTVI